jgi:ABC-type iron transport system FetAB ATPase subunit
MDIRFKIKGLRTVCGGPFSFSLERGECVALSGPSGCGKTLLLRALADLDPAEGSVRIDGVDRNEMPAPEWRRQVGWLPAESSWWFDRVGEHFPNLGTLLHRDAQNFPNIGKRDELAPRSAEEQRSCFHCLETLGFEEDVLEWRVERLSTGERQRLALFRLLLNEPKALLLDEPTAALDVSNVRKVEALISNVRKTTGAAILWVSHDVEQIERVADRHLKLWEAS